MNFQNRFAVRGLSILSLLLAAVVLTIGLTYALGHAYVVPSTGFSLDNQWKIIEFDTLCASQEPSAEIADWCMRTTGLLELGDQIVALAYPEHQTRYTSQQYRDDPLLVPFFGLSQGEEVIITVDRNGQIVDIPWPIRGTTLRAQLTRLAVSLLFMPFWLAGTAVLLFLRPRDTRWRLLIAFNYTTGLWLAIGTVSVTRIFGSLLLVALLSWVLMPVYLHFHLLLPYPLIPPRYRHGFYGLYAFALIMATLLLFKVVPPVTYYFAILLGMGGSLGILIFRALRPLSPHLRPGSRLMLTGLSVAVLPGILWIVPALRVGSGPATATVTLLVILAMPALPFFYTYVLYKHRLGGIEIRANRALSLYSFAVFYATFFVVLFVAFYQQPAFNAPALWSALGTSGICLALAWLTWDPLKRTLNRMAYGTIYEPEQLIRHFANEIPRALNRHHLMRLLSNQVMPTLLIRQSALFWLADAEHPLIYSDTVDARTIAHPSPERLDQLRTHIGHFLDKENLLESPFGWVRLIVPVEVDAHLIGLWLLGRRDPDDFYPNSDIELLNTLSNQIAVTLETIRLFEMAQQRANQLERANFQLRRTNRLKSDLLRNITHELRTPLSTIYGYAELLLMGEGGELSPEQQELAQIIASSSQDLVHMVRDILTLQQNRINQVEGKLVDLRDLAYANIQQSEAVQEEKNVWRRGNHQILLQPGDTKLCVWADPLQLGQVFTHLLSNALKFSPRGGTIQVTQWMGEFAFEQELEEGFTAVKRPAIYTAVQDHGIGIAPEEFDNIWMEFYQIDASATRHFGGTGLGLALVKDIVEIHGGKIWVESTPGKGSTFTFALPRVVSEDEERGA